MENFTFIGNHTGAIIKDQMRVIFSAVCQNHLLLLEQPQTAHILVCFDTLQSSLEGKGEDHDSDLNLDIFNDSDSEPEPEPEIQNDSDPEPEPEPEIQNDSDSGSEPEPASPGEVEAEPLPERPRPGTGDRRISTRSSKGIRVTESLEAEGLRHGWHRRAGGDGPRASVANTDITLDDITNPRSWGEAMAATQGVKEALWERRLLTEIGRLGLVHQKENQEAKAVLIQTDNQGCLALARNPEFHDRTKHIDIQYHWIREVLDSGRVEMHFVGTEDQVAGIFTKPLSKEKFERFKREPGMRGGLEECLLCLFIFVFFVVCLKSSTSGSVE